MSNTKTGLAAFGAAALTAAYMTLNVTGLLKTEDLKTTAYVDMVGVPTVCVGETRGVKMGDKYTREECLQMLEKRVAEFDRNLGRCIKTELPMETRSAVLQWAYNVGTGAACSSTVAKHLNAGRIEQACNGLMVWNKGTFNQRGAAAQMKRGEKCTKRANGKYLCTIRGLTNRREEERQLCLEGIGK
jgi:lysozyme